VRLPECFYAAGGGKGRGKSGGSGGGSSGGGQAGFVEWGFMSTTSSKTIAVQYACGSGGAPTILRIRPAAVDHGADIGRFSQYPGEREYLWNPCRRVCVRLGGNEIERADNRRKGRRG
jgi:hypothetical protein